jgi:hypothetical protein
VQPAVGGSLHTGIEAASALSDVAVAGVRGVAVNVLVICLLQQAALYSAVCSAAKKYLTEVLRGTKRQHRP